jgi:hypothetical protein
MKILDRTSEELFNKIRGKFSQVTIGDENGEVTNEQTRARYFNFKFKSRGKTLGDVNIALEEERGLTIIYSKDFIKNQKDLIKKEWYSFLKDMRKFAKKRLLQFDVRDITKSNLSKKDFEWLSKQQKSKSGDDSKMNESKMYGTNKTSYQRIGNARLSIKHSAPINVENSAGRTQKISNIFIESPEGEKFRYPYRHLSGARAMARHVSEGGTAYDDFGKYISSLSEELSKLRKFNTYMGRTGVMAETLGEYTDIVKERASVIRKEIQNLQKENYYKEKIEGFSAPIVEEVPADVTENWIDQLTIRQFNEELKDVFPYIYRLVGEAKRVEEIGPEDLEEKSDPCWDNYKMVGTKEKNGKTVPNCVPESEELSEDRYRTNLKYQVADADYKNHIIYVSKNPILQNKFFAHAVAIHNGKELKELISTAEDASQAVELIKQKLDSSIADAPKATESSILNFNSPFTQAFFQNDAGNLGIENIRMIYAKVELGPKIIIANVSNYQNEEEIKQDGFYRLENRSRGTNPMFALGLNPSKVRKLDLIAKGRYVLSKPVKTAEGHYEYNMTFINAVTNKTDIMRMNVPGVQVGSSLPSVKQETNLNFENYIEEYFEDLMGHFSDKKIKEDEEDPREGHVWVKFQTKFAAQTREPYLALYAGFGNGPNDVTFDSAPIKYFPKTSEQIYKVVTNIQNERVFVNVKKVYVYNQNLNNPMLIEFFELLTKNYQGNMIEIVNKPIVDPKTKDTKDTVAYAEIWIKGLDKKVNIGPGSFVVTRKINKNLTDFTNKITTLKTGDEVVITDGEYIGKTGSVQNIFRKQDINKEKGTADQKPYANIKPKDYKKPSNIKMITFRMSAKFFGTVIGKDGEPGKDPKFSWVRQFRRGQFGDFVMPEDKFELFKKQAEALDIPYKKRGSNKIVKLDPKIEIINVAESQSDQNQKKSKTPLGEFILSYFDRNTARFPKGEQAVLTAVEKDYGDRYVEPARQFIEQVTATTLEYLQQTANQPRLPETQMIKRLAGI